jgi:hypothetical protein
MNEVAKRKIIVSVRNRTTAFQLVEDPKLNISQLSLKYYGLCKWNVTAILHFDQYFSEQKNS